MLGFGEGEGREKENREERQSFFCAYVFLCLGFYRVLGKVFLCLFIYFFYIYVFFNTVLTWKIVRASKVLVYIYIYREIRCYLCCLVVI